MPKHYINQTQAAKELGISRPRVAQLLRAGFIVGARKPQGAKDWRIPTPVQRNEGTRGFKSKKAQERDAFMAHLEELAETEHLYACSVSDLHQHIEEGSVDCIITDPPYIAEAVPLYEELAQFAAYALKPGGSLVAMAGQSYLPDVISGMRFHLKYQWMAAYLTPGGQAVQLWDRKVNTFWKPLLWYVKGEYTGKWIGDVTRSSVNDNDKRFHEWGQSESGMADVVRRFTLEGDIVLDPFLGGGTTAIVCRDLHRRFIGSDIDVDMIRKTKERLANG